MAAKKTPKHDPVTDPPESLQNHQFFGLTLDPEQEAFRDAIWSPDALIVFCDAAAGTGKTTVAVMTAELLYQYKRYDGIVYVTAPVQESRIGFLPGTVQEKTLIYAEPFYQAAIRAGINPYVSIRTDAMFQKDVMAYIDCVPHNYLRGCTFENKVVIIDEAQNYQFEELKKTLTRVTDNCKTIVIGHTGQIDINHRRSPFARYTLAPPSDPSSAFERYINHFRGEPYARICQLSTNHRGLVAYHADQLDINDKGE